MRWHVAAAVALGAVAAGSGCARSPGSPAGSSAAATEGLAGPGTRVPGEYLVTLAAQADARAIADVYGRFGIRRTQDLGRGIFLVTLEDDPGPARMEELRKQGTRIQAVQPNLAYRGTN